MIREDPEDVEIMSSCATGMEIRSQNLPQDNVRPMEEKLLELK